MSSLVKGEGLPAGMQQLATLRQQILTAGAGAMLILSALRKATSGTLPTLLAWRVDSLRASSLSVPDARSQIYPIRLFC